MAKKIEIINNSLVVTDTISGVVDIEHPKRDVFFHNDKLNDGDIKLIDTDGVNIKASGISFEQPLANCVDAALAVFTEATWRAFARTSLGFNAPSGGNEGLVTDVFNVVDPGKSVFKTSKDIVGGFIMTEDGLDNLLRSSSKTASDQVTTTTTVPAGVTVKITYLATL